MTLGGSIPCKKDKNAGPGGRAGLPIMDLLEGIPLSKYESEIARRRTFAIIFP